MNFETASQPILSIAIPTWNRMSYLSITLGQLHRETSILPISDVEIIVSDNYSSDGTQDVVDQCLASGMNINYIRNEENIGSDKNIAQCFNISRGKYVLLLGDDDILVDGAIAWLLDKLKRDDYGVVFLRPYGFDQDFRKEYPRHGGVEKEYKNAGEFFAKIGEQSALISANVFNKSLLAEIDANQFCGSNLVHLHLIIRAALAGKRNCATDRYWLAYKRNNFGYYDFSKVFVENFYKILDQYSEASQPGGLSKTSIRNVERRMLIGFFPAFVWKQRLAKDISISMVKNRFDQRFGKRLDYRFFVLPIFSLPRPIAIFWGVVSMATGRVLMGSGRRGLYFFVNKIFKLLSFH